MIAWLKKLLRREPPPPPPPPPVLAHWVPGTFDRSAYCGEGEPGVYAVDAQSFMTMRDRCTPCSRAAWSRLMAYRTKNR